jgi:hypothetical protein
MPVRKRLGIPNPYSFKEIYDADKQWKKFQKFAVPSLDQFSEIGDQIKENLKPRMNVSKAKVDDGDFNL